MSPVAAPVEFGAGQAASRDERRAVDDTEPMQVRPNAPSSHNLHKPDAAADVASTRGAGGPADNGAVQEAHKGGKAKKGKKAGGEDEEADLEAQGLAPDGTPLVGDGGETGSGFANPVQALQAAESAFDLAAGARDRGLAAAKIVGR